MNYNDENDKLFNDFIDLYFYKDWAKTKGIHNHELHSVELIISPKCNLGCKYCYIYKHRNTMFRTEIFDEKSTIINLKKFLNWLVQNNYSPAIDIFSGELFAQKIGYKVLDTIYDFYKECDVSVRPPSIMIPTNFTFICSDEYTKKVEQYLYKFRDINIRLFLSSSFDGKFLEENRPYLGNMDIDFNVVRDDEYYNKVFTFISKHHCGLHPMVDSRGIEKWKDNFLWFQDMMKKHNIAWHSLYLLQVRDANWTPKQNKDLYNFVKFLVHWLFDKCEHDKNLFLKVLLNVAPRGFNILHEPFGNNATGMSCAIQKELTVRLSDLKIFPCHRLMYPELELGQYDDNFHINTKNAELGITINTTHHKNHPMCHVCPIRTICLGGCLGSQVETTGELFAPIPSVCRNTIALYKGIFDGLDEINMLNTVLNQISEEKRYDILKLREIEHYGK